MTRLTILHDADGFGVAACGPIIIGCWRRPGRLADLPIFTRHEDRLLKTHPTGLRVLSIMSGQESLGAEDGLRQEAARLAKKYGDAVLCNGTVLRASGLASVFARSFLTGVQLLSRTRYPSKVFAEAEPAARWVAQTPEPMPDVIADIDTFIADVERFIQGPHKQAASAAM